MHSSFNSAARTLFSRTPRPPDNREGVRLVETLPAEVQGPWTLLGRCGSAVRAGTLRIQEVPGWRAGPPGRAQRNVWWQARLEVQPHRSGSHLVPGPCRPHPLCQCPRSLRCDGCPCCTYCTRYQGRTSRTDGHREGPDHRQVRRQPIEIENKWCKEFIEGKREEEEWTTCIQREMRGWKMSLEGEREMTTCRWNV